MSTAKANQNKNSKSFAYSSINCLAEIMDKFNLSTREFKALFRLLHYTQNGNQCRVTQSQIMRDIDCLPTNSTKIFKKLKDCCALIQKDGELFINPHLFTVSNFGKDAKVSAELVEFAAEEMEKRGLTPSLTTPGMKAKNAAMSAA